MPVLWWLGGVASWGREGGLGMVGGFVVRERASGSVCGGVSLLGADGAEGADGAGADGADGAGWEGDGDSGTTEGEMVVGLLTRKVRVRVVGMMWMCADGFVPVWRGFHVFSTFLAVLQVGPEAGGSGSCCAFVVDVVNEWLHVLYGLVLLGWNRVASLLVE